MISPFFHDKRRPKKKKKKKIKFALRNLIQTM